MATGLISKKYLIDIANAIRVMLDSESTYTPAQMATAIANIDGSITGTITKSSNADVGIITDTLLDDICDALRTKLDDDTLSFTPSQIADAILTISGGGGGSVEIVSFASGTDAQIAAMIQAAHNGDIDLQTDGGWAVGNTRAISISSFNDGNTNFSAQTKNIVISSFNDYESCGCVMQFDFKQVIEPGTRMNDLNMSDSPYYYGNTLMYKNTLPAFVDALPAWLKNLLITFDVIAGKSYDTAIVQNNKLALRSEKEITGSKSKATYSAGSLIPYYSESSNRQKGYWYWTRDYANNDGSVYINTDGVARTRKSYNNDVYIAPFGCV